MCLVRRATRLSSLCSGLARNRLVVPPARTASKRSAQSFYFKGTPPTP